MQAVTSRKRKTNVTIEEQLERLTGIVGALAATTASHDDQIEDLITVDEKHSERIGQLLAVAEKHDEQMAKQSERIDKLVRDWQAYLTTIRPQ